jgi:hypothetical protein
LDVKIKDIDSKEFEDEYIATAVDSIDQGNKQKIMDETNGKQERKDI